MGAVPLELPDSWSYGLLRGSATVEYDGALDRRSSFAVMRSSVRYGFYSADRPLRLAIYRKNMRTARRSGDLVTLVLALYATVSISFYLVSVRYFDIGEPVIDRVAVAEIVLLSVAWFTLLLTVLAPARFLLIILSAVLTLCGIVLAPVIITAAIYTVWPMILISAGCPIAFIASVRVFLWWRNSRS